MDDQQRARELLAQEWRKLSEDAPADMLVAGCELPPLVAASIAAITAALRAAPNAAALRVAMQSLEQIASAPDDQGAKFNAMGALRFLQTQPVELSAAPEGFVLVPVELLESLADEAEAGIHQTVFNPGKRDRHMGKVRDARALLAARPQGVKDV